MNQTAMHRDGVPSAQCLVPTQRMKYRYGKYIGDDLEGLDLGDLVSKLSDLLLSSGFQSPYRPLR